MKYFYICPRCGKGQDYSGRFLFCGGCGEAVHKNNIIIKPDGGSIEYECCVCGEKMEYDGEARFCGSCGSNIVKSVVRICEDMQKLEKRQKRDEEYSESRLSNLMMENYRKKRAIKFYKELCSDENISLKEAVEKSDAEIKKIEDKLKTQRHNTKLFMTDEIYSDCWNHYCKRLFPEQKKGGAISPVHIFNAYMMCKNRRDYLGAYSFSPVYVVRQNDVYLEGTNQDISLYKYWKPGNNIYMMFPSCNVAEYGYERYSSLFKAEFSEKNKDKKYGKCYVKEPCGLEKVNDSLTLRKKGVLVYITDEEYNTVSEYYNAVITAAEREEKSALYYYLLDEFYKNFADGGINKHYENTEENNADAVSEYHSEEVTKAEDEEAIKVENEDVTTAEDKEKKDEAIGELLSVLAARQKSMS